LREEKVKKEKREEKKIGDVKKVKKELLRVGQWSYGIGDEFEVCM